MTANYLPSVKNLFLQLNCLIITTIGLMFGYWFAHAQVAAVAPNALANYPVLFIVLTILKCTLTVMASYAVIKWVFSNIAVNKYNPEVLALSFAPLVLVLVNTSLLHCLEMIILIQLAYLLTMLRVSDYQTLSKRYGIDCLALISFFVLHLFLTTTYSPLHLNMALLTSIGYYGEETYALAPVFKGFVLAKQFSFTNIDHSQWSGIMNPPITLASPFMQLLTLIFDLPSISYPAFHQALMIVSFILMVLGSFGFYLFLNLSLKVNKLFAFWGGFLFFFSGAPLTYAMFLRDGGVFLSPYAVFPYALLLISYAFTKNDGRYAAGAGVALAAQFFFLTPHPEGVIFSLLFYGVYVLGLVLFTRKYPFLKKIQLASLSIGLFFILSSYVFIPILVDRFMGNMYVFAHTGDLEVVHLATFNRYITIGLISLVIAFTALWKRKQLTPAFLSIVFLAFALFGIIWITTSLADITYLMHKLHIGLHFWYYWRIGMYFSMTVFVITCVALQELTDFACNKKGRLYWIISLIMIAFSCLFFPFKFLTSDELVENPNACPYYITLQSNLANYPLLATDQGNSRFIKQRLLQFEKDLNTSSADPQLISGYKNSYVQQLTTLGLHSIADATSAAMIISAAKITYPVVDNFYLDKKLFCVTSLYDWNISAKKRVLRLNLSSLYDNLPSRYMRILFAVDSGFHLGAFSGFFVNNQSTTLNTQFMSGMPLLTSLYVIPKYNFDRIGGYNGLVPWCAFWSGFVTDPELRKIVNISGIDVFTLLDKELTQRQITTIPDAILLPSNIAPQFDPGVKTYINTASYGMAYLANHITYDPHQVTHYERMIKHFFAYPERREVMKLESATSGLYQMLNQLKEKGDILLEAPTPLAAQTEIEKELPGTINIEGIVGPRALFSIDCLRSSCTFVLNIAKVPGWDALVNNHFVKISRVNFAFMGITVPHGKSTIWFIYEPIPALFCYVLSLLTFISILLVCSRSTKANAT